MTEPRPVYVTMQGAEVELCKDSPPELAVDGSWMGPLVKLWRRYRDGTMSEVVLPRFMAECVVAAIPECEPDVARARIERG